MYVKLFGSILDSSIWSADPTTRIVWITMLAMADEFGIVYASIDGLARRAQVATQQCRKALKVLEAPDENDRSGVAQGCRIRALQGAWEVINYKKYRELRTQKQVANAARQARYRELHGVTERDNPVTSVTVGDVTTEAEAEAEAEANTKPKTTTARSRVAQAHWVRELGSIWRNRYHGEPPWAKMGKLLKPVKDAPDLVHRFTAYVAATEPRYVNLAKFVASFGSWGNGKPTPQTYGPYIPGQSGPNL